MAARIVLEGLQTEGRNLRSQNIDRVGTTELCRIINQDDGTIAKAVEKCIPEIAGAIDALEPRLQNGGRVVYVGAGTSGRLGVLDASEIPPTYSASSEQFIALIAGGDAALRYAQEGAEDDMEAAIRDLKALKLSGDVDSLVGIAASGRTPYVLSCLSYARSLKCTTVGIACAEPSKMSSEGNVDHMISVVTGPEVVTGSTRMKAGTATKLVLNMLSTGLMIRLGKTYGNMMIDLKATNEKLQQRSRNIIRSICGAESPESDFELDKLLLASRGSVKIAVGSILLHTTVTDATERLAKVGGVLSRVLENPICPKSNGAISNGHGTEEYVLCVDGGGSKCAAVILGKGGSVGRGEAGECNILNVGFDNAMATISLAIQRAVDSLPSLACTPFQSIRFANIRVGIAGYDRPNLSGRVDAALSRLFNRSIGKRLNVSNDIDLVVSTVRDEKNLDSVVVLVAGTGSVVMSYESNGNQLKRTGRSGGWGPLLGDDGSGYSIGRHGVRLALESADAQNSSRKDNHGDPLIDRVFEHFGLVNLDDDRPDLLSRVLSPESGDEQAEVNIPKRIAEVARIVLNASAASQAAMGIIQAESRNLVRTAETLLRQREINASSSTLVLAGGLMHNEMYRRLISNELERSEIEFKRTRAVCEPALEASQQMLEQL